MLGRGLYARTVKHGVLQKRVQERVYLRGCVPATLHCGRLLALRVRPARRGKELTCAQAVGRRLARDRRVARKLSRRGRGFEEERGISKMTRTTWVAETPDGT